MIHLSRSGPRSLHEQLYTGLKNQIISGALKADYRLPATRTLAEDYSISRNTVITAYRQLEVEGFVRSRVGSGYYVERMPQTRMAPPARDTAINEATEGDGHQPTHTQGPAHDFVYGSIDLNIYRTRGFRKALNVALTAQENLPRLGYTGAQGDWRLRMALTDYLHTSRGISTTAESVIITGGHHFACQLLTELFPQTAYSFAMEEPGYPGARDVFHQAGYALHAVPLEENGISLDALKGLTRTMLYVTPSHQFPLGYVLPIGQRMALLQWAEQSDSYIIEDDYDSELRYSDMLIPSLQSIDSNNRVIYLGSFSKALSPDLRVSYVVLPKGMDARLSQRYPYLNCPVPDMIQKALAHYMESGEFRKRLNTTRLSLRRKHDQILKYLEDNYSERISVESSGGGMHFVLNLDTSLHQADIIRHFAHHQVGVYPTKPMWMHPGNCRDNQIIIGYGGIAPSQLAAALEAFGSAASSLPH